MVWSYSQSSGDLRQNGIYVGVGYSGHGTGLNNPFAQNQVGVGPLPQGKYSIGTFFDHPHLGPCVSHLAPLPPTNTFGRSGFFIHGDNAQLNHTGSDGCIVLDPDLREEIAKSGLNQILEVTL